MHTKPSLARRRTRICRLEALESRLLLSADLRLDPLLTVDSGIPAIATAANAPAAQIAAAKLYLDFDGTPA